MKREDDVVLAIFALLVAAWIFGLLYWDVIRF